MRTVSAPDGDPQTPNLACLQNDQATIRKPGYPTKPQSVLQNHRLRITAPDGQTIAGACHPEQSHTDRTDRPQPTSLLPVERHQSILFKYFPESMFPSLKK